MNPALQIKTILRGRDSAQGVVVEAGDGSALVSLPGGSRTVQTDVTVRAGDVVTVRAGRVISKRTGGAGGAIKIYNV